MKSVEQKFYDTFIRPQRNGPALKLTIFLALECFRSRKAFSLSYRELAKQVGLDRPTLVQAVKRLLAFPAQGAPPALERLQKGRGRRPSSYVVHLPDMVCV